jgi:nucleotide-binding universal stress UspA family protein
MIEPQKPAALRIVHAAAMSEDDRTPLTYAATLAQAAGAELISVHATGMGASSENLIDANECLGALGLERDLQHTRLIHSCCDDPVDTTLDAIRRAEPDLLVAGTHARGVLSRVILDSRAEALARNAPMPTLVVPLREDRKGDGRFRLRRVLVPAEDAAALEASLSILRRLAVATRTMEGELLVLGVGVEPPEAKDLPEGWKARSLKVEGTNVAHAVAVAAGDDVDLIVMATRGRDSFVDALMGTHTEQVLHQCHCPLLSVPMQEG